MKKALISLLAVVAVFVYIPIVAYAQIDKTADDGVAWVLGWEDGGQCEFSCKWITVDGITYDCRWQCVDFVNAYTYYLTNTSRNGNANTYNNGVLPDDDNYTLIQKYSGFVPAKGDILIWDGGTVGHVAIVTAVNSNTEVVYSDQNGGGYTQKIHHGRKMNPSTNDYWGVIRPDFKPNDIIPPIVNVARKQNETTEGFDVVVEATDNIGVSKILIGTWHSRMSVDDAVWQEAVPNQNGRAIFHVRYSSFGNVTNVEYYTNAYAIDVYGNYSEAMKCYSFEDLGDDFYATIIHDSSGGFWENDKNAIRISESTEYAYDTDPKRIWHFVKQKTGDYAGSYEIICESNNRCVDINSFGLDDGTSINLLDRAHNAAQRFYVCLNTQKEYPRYIFRSVYCNGALDAQGTYTDSGGIIQLWHVNNTDAQLFQINNLADSEYNYPGRIAPQAPTIEVVVSGQNTTLLWNSPVSQAFDERAYHVVLYSGNSTDGSILYEATNTKKESHTITLNPGTYTVKITAKNTKYENLISEESKSFSVSAFTTYTIHYDANGGIIPPEDQTKIHDTALTLSPDEPKRETSTGNYSVRFKIVQDDGSIVYSNVTSAPWTISYTFKNWNTAINGSGTSYKPGESYTANASATLYAQWNSTKTTGSVPLPDSPTCTDSVFMGWATTKTASSGIFGSYTPTCDGDVTLYPTWKKMDIILPAALTEIESEAFDSCAFSSVMLSEKTTTIRRSAFVDCPNLKYIYIPAETISIDGYAFLGVDDLTILGQRGSYAETYAQERGFAFLPAA